MNIKSLLMLFVALALLTAAKISTSTAAAQTADGKFTEREVTFAGAAGLQLHGTLVLPGASKRKVPGVLFLSGSGPTDRNGNQPPQFMTDLMKQIAERLAAEGIASLRFDKRATHGYARSWPAGDGALKDFFGWENFVGDAKAALAFLQTQPKVNSKQTVVAGHSEGGMIAMQLAHDLTAGAPAALILISSPGRPLRVLLAEQISASLKRSGLTSEAAKPYEDNLQLTMNQVIKDGTLPPDVLPGLAPLFPPSALKLLQNELAFDPVKVLPAFSGPVLVVQGEKDIQVSAMRDFPSLQSMLKGRKLGTYEAFIVLSASHNLKHVENENAEPGFAGPVVPQALDKISEWLKKTLTH